MFSTRLIKPQLWKGVNFPAVPRFISTSSIRLNADSNKNPKSPSESTSTGGSGKKRPLSRIAIGGEQSKQKFAAGNSIEFASWKAVIVLLVAGGAATYWFSREKERIRIQKEVESKRSYGKPLVGGNFTLMDTEGDKFTQENLKNDKKMFSIIYFGFTHCPDVCPEELDKLGEMLTELDKDKIQLQPIFITCDPARDTPDVIKTYLSDFHPSIIGLTGTYEAIKNTCKKYRVYFSTPPNVKPGQDYLVDHSIFFYLMDSEGSFVDVIGREVDSKEGAQKIRDHVDAFIPQAEREKRQEGWLSFLYK
ncbi:Cu-binding protein [Yamadazyma tenuis]|uniref:Putative cytochrome C oxidase assembly protein n=1 Tax=Candida tenuis (strain ATCC 10573 / BCRC 21748 / CBS 615 / JCM 9827 / NBRC 10315 / NRRL Y-1498 / VKM Y-70) TaxID=590646 RepID=G3AYX6_CANTC|nr:putative cytochrome C oxidase assembly protein [Yamadazyma tenuis ATCC 10573]EGV65955.1 putative cytochrome C oxidase assembly protein [Yamadazyma tenuis ATCC 10573]WEJ95712.1 Cu-binding protein [Yamadazyma tenuis]